MTRPYRLSRRAEQDLEEIWDYTAERWSAAQAERYIHSIRSAIEAVAEHPMSGKACDELRAGYRRCSAGSHVVFYTLERHGVLVVRILHQRMDFRQRL